MKFSYRWLQELSGTEKSPEELAEFLTMRAFEVEEITSVGFSVPQVIVGTVLAIEKHPNADRLRVARLDMGASGERIVVCGAPNLALGQKVAVALPGAVLPGNLSIEKAEIRGVVSDGMICSEKELGLGEHHDGIFVLSEFAEAGVALVDFLGSGDSVLDVKILPDRAHDCLSHVGLAREIAALEGRELDYDYDGLLLPKPEGKSPFDISLDAVKGMSLRYVGALVRGVSVGASPKWLADRLNVFGMRSVNNIVDATNFIMLELGQPLHAFDWNAISGAERKTIGPRLAHAGEELELLNGKTISLGSEDIVIADGERALALGGIMGGIDSGVRAETKDIFLESAHFDPVAIRRTRTRLGIESDASIRFEKGLSPDLAGRAMTRLLEIITHIAGGEVASVSERRVETPGPSPIVFSPDSVSSFLGTDVSAREMESVLKLRGFSVHFDGKYIEAVPPLYRLDIGSVADIAEEIGKGVGYDRIESEAPNFLLSSIPEDPVWTCEVSFRDYLAASGFTEVFNYSFYSEADAMRTRFDKGKHFSLENPMNSDQALVRLSLLPGLLRNVAFNGRRFHDVRLFELGKTYERVDGSPLETRRVSGVVRISPKDDGAESFSAISSGISRLLLSLRVPYSIRPIQPDKSSIWHPTRTADLIGPSGERFGSMGEIHPSIVKSMAISGRVSAFEFDVRALLAILPTDWAFAPIRKYPETLRDISCFVRPHTSVAEVEQCIADFGEGMVLGVELFDRYASPEGGRSLAFHIRLGRDDRSLTGEEADAVFLNISRGIESRLNGTLRSSSKDFPGSLS